MPELCKKINFFLLFFIFLVPLTYASFDECKGQMYIEDSPCNIFLPKGDLNCSQHNISVYHNSTNIYNLTLTDYNSVYCNATFNITTVGTYTFAFSTGDSGSINITEGYRMILLYFFVLTILIGLIVAAIVYEDTFFSTMASFGMMAVGVFIHINGFSSLSNLVTDFLALLFILGGFYFLVPLFEYTQNLLNGTSS